MPGGREAHGSSIVEVLDRILDKGIVIDAAVRLSVAGIELLTVDARVVVASIQTYLRHADAISFTSLASPPRTPAVAAVEAGSRHEADSREGGGPPPVGGALLSS